MKTILDADIGGTNSRFAFFQSDPDANLSLQDGIWLPTGKAAVVGLIFILVIEDSLTGVRAALAAGMACIAVSTPFTKSALHADGILDDRWVVDDPDTLPAVVDRTMACRTGRKRA